MTTPLRCVVDASVGVKLYIPDPITPKVEALFDHLTDIQAELFVPDLFYIECANTIWKYIRANLYNVADLAADLASLQSLSLKVVSTADLMAEAVAIGVAHGISAYDGCYVALSQQTNAPLLTLDQKLVTTLTGTTYDVRLFTHFSVPPLSL